MIKRMGKNWNPSLESGEFRRPEAQEQKVVLAFCYRYDAHLVPSLLQNLEPSVHAWVAWDDRISDATFTDETIRRRELLAVLRELRADWVLVADPDERFEDRLRNRIRNLARPEQDVIWSFHLREMFTSTAYRSDSVWGRKERASLFPLTDDIFVPDRSLHGNWFGYEIEKPIRRTGLNFYHLRMISPTRRKARRDLYAAADPDRQFQAIGYDYLNDERTLELTEIQTPRQYTPLHVEDDGLWMAEAPLRRDPEPDRDWNRFCFLKRLGHAGDAGMRSMVARDIAEGMGEDIDQAFVAVWAHISARRFAEAEALLATLPETPLCHLMSSRLRQRQGDPAGAKAAAAAAQAALPGCRLTEVQLARCRDTPDRFTAEGALWRRWVTGAAEIREGRDVQSSELAVVVIGYKAPRELAEAVRSLRVQNPTVEIVVVNSGGGDLVGVLEEHLEAVRLIEIEERLFVGAARNVGIDASHAPFVGFLASDCTACSGWVRHRLDRHADGNEAIGSALMPHRNRSLFSLTSNVWLHWRRRPAPENPGPRAARIILRALAVRGLGALLARSAGHRGHGAEPAVIRSGED